MITHQHMVELYGADQIITLSPEEVDRFSLMSADAHVLTDIGLPRDSSPFFTTDVQGGPEFLTVIDLTRKNGREHREVIIGGPPGDPGMRYSVSAYEGFIMLAQLAGTKPRGEVVNNNLSEFIEFLYRIERFRRYASDEPAAHAEELDNLKRTLVGIDPFSFELAEDWWSIALHQLGGGGIDL
ncbi:SUKH-4 family immunity protein [Streptomyces asiaticus]